MKRILIHVLAVIALLASSSLSGCQKADDGSSAQKSPEILPTGQFQSDSLRVGLSLPASPGWSFKLDPPIRGGPYVTAHHEGETASVRLFVTPGSNVEDIETLAKRRRDQLAGLFGVSDLEQVIERVIGEDRQEVLGHPAVRWQAITQPVDVAGEEPSRVLFMWIMTVRPEFAYECIGLARIPVDPTPEQRAANEGLIMDMAAILESIEFR